MTGYDGQGDLTEYLQHFETVAEWNQWSSTNNATQLAMNLSGPARMVLADLPPHVSNSYHDLACCLKQRFCPDGREPVNKAEFQRRRKQHNETVTEFGYALRRLSLRAFPRISLDAGEEWVLDQFLSGLNNIDMRKHVQLSHPVTLEEAIGMATEYESFQTSKTPTKKPVNAVAKSASSDTDIKQLQEVVTALAGKGDAFFNLSVWQDGPLC